ncbi:S-adenosyl-L-methionine-dependent methyltransferase [Macrolepiota fuliginosa MF-IS2]|uniref:S-adenosyl-L-methionine-dependent methyltransferase n=1 Tax=Macrolepiota fuliginosa MF-IS2 TaxID=1400762 RepID=A0A9P6CAJ3_9AGAR|nr:S-adenosyl-L-methionine-dependent methyltransferase [Macrolepiota fuliginosa MF-IS2]
MSHSEITSLQNTLNAALDVFKAELAAQQLSEPSLNTSKPHPTDDISFLPTPAMFEARRTALACLGLVKTLIQSPYDALAANTWMNLEVAGLRLAADIGLATVLGDSEDGLSIAEIADKTGVDGLKLERVLRLLITQGWFRETRQGYFANNRMSNTIKNDQPGFHLATYMNALFSKVSDSYPAMINHPEQDFRKNTDPFHTAFQLAYDTDVTYFGAGGWLTKDPQEAVKFGLAMGAVGPTSDPGVAADFPWVEICKGKDGIVDVGGGQGTLCCSLATKYPEIKRFIVQDLPETREAAESYIASKNLSHKVTFEAQDFFKPQQRKGKYVYVMQRVLHDWSTEDGAKMLGHIRDVLNENSCLLIIDTVVQPAVVSGTGPSFKESLSKLDPAVYEPVPPPQFLPVDFGEASRIQHQINVALTALCNSFERTLPQLEEMVTKGGLKIKKVHATRGWASITEVEVA